MAQPLLANNPDNYIVPSAISIFFAPRLNDGSLGSWVDLGNTMDLVLTLTDETLQHMSTRNGLSAPDKRVITQLTGQVKFSLDELVGSNLVYLYRPATAVESTTYDVIDAKRIVLTDTTAEIIDPFALESSADDNVELDNVVVRSTDGLTTYVENTDYTLTQASGTGSGRVGASLARTSGSSIVSGAEVYVSYTYNRVATKYDIQTGAIIEGAMRVQLMNRIGPLCAWAFPRVNLQPDGDLTVTPTDWLKSAFTAEILTAGNGSRGSFYLFDQYNKLEVAA